MKVRSRLHEGIYDHLHPDDRPTGSKDFVKVGDRCVRVGSRESMQGTVEKVVMFAGRGDYGQARVLWDSGSKGTHQLSTLRRVP